jgi:hypothetical protein
VYFTICTVGCQTGGISAPAPACGARAGCLFLRRRWPRLSSSRTLGSLHACILASIPGPTPQALRLVPCINEADLADLAVVRLARNMMAHARSSRRWGCIVPCAASDHQSTLSRPSRLGVRMTRCRHFALLGGRLGRCHRCEKGKRGVALVPLCHAMWRRLSRLPHVKLGSRELTWTQCGLADLVRLGRMAVTV